MATTLAISATARQPAPAGEKTTLAIRCQRTGSARRLIRIAQEAQLVKVVEETVDVGAPDRHFRALVEENQGVQENRPVVRPLTGIALARGAAGHCLPRSQSGAPGNSAARRMLPCSVGSALLLRRCHS